MTRYYIFILCVISFEIKAQDYYSSSQSLYGNELRIQLHNLIDNHTIISYSNCIAALKQSDADENDENSIRLIYKNTSIDNSNFAYDIDNPIHLDYWNREHVWAKSLGSFGPGGLYEDSHAYTDLHNLKPADMSVNYDRSNKGFNNGGTQHMEAANCYFTENSWEAPNDSKGDIARILFYMDIRYNGANNEPALTITENLNTYPNPQIGVLSTLLEWHISDPVDAFELNRNDIIFGWQNNRNPFIDHPEYVERIWGEDSVQDIQNTTDLIISEYIEGSSNNKAIELYNTGENTIDLSNYQVLKITNGGDWGEQSYDLTGQLPPGETYIICHSSASNTISQLSDTQLNLNHNGNDALAISYNGIIVDVIGTDGDSPTGGWDVAGINTATKNHTLVRKPNISTGNTNWENSAGTTAENSEWLVLDMDDFSNLGFHSTSTDNEIQTTNIPIGWFILGLNLEPIQNSIPSIFESINPDLIIVKDYLGNVYLPEYDFNNINDYELGMAYQLKTSSENVLEISGTSTNSISTLPLGWYLFSPLNSIEENIEIPFSSVTESVIIIKDYFGNAYIPNYDFNGIGNITPGYGYQIKTNEQITIEW